MDLSSEKGRIKKADIRKVGEPSHELDPCTRRSLVPFWVRAHTLFWGLDHAGGNQWMLMLLFHRRFSLSPLLFFKIN